MQMEMTLHYGKLVVNDRGEVLITCTSGETLAIDAGEHADARVVLRSNDGSVRVQSKLSTL